MQELDPSSGKTVALIVARTENKKRKGANAYLRVVASIDAFETTEPAAWLALLAITVATVAFAVAGAALDAFGFSLAAGVSTWAKGQSAPRLHVPLGKNKHGTVGLPLASA